MSCRAGHIQIRMTCVVSIPYMVSINTIYGVGTIYGIINYVNEGAVIVMRDIFVKLLSSLMIDIDSVNIMKLIVGS